MVKIETFCQDGVVFDLFRGCWEDDPVPQMFSFSSLPDLEEDKSSVREGILGLSVPLKCGSLVPQA